jgi:hypothetical protein
VNALIYAVNEVKSQIPFELIHAGLMIDETDVTSNLTTLDDKLLRKVIRKRILLDANIVGGVETIIPLNNVPPSYSEYYFTVYQIPPELTMNREIISALNIVSVPVNGFYGNSGGFGNQVGNGSPGSFGNFGLQNPVMGVADRIGNAAAPTGNVSNANLEIVAYNTVLVYANYRNLASFGMRVVLENETNLNNIQPRSYKTLGMLCTLGTKAYLYNKLIIAINSGQLSGGQDLGTFRSILESYSSAEEEYRTYLREIWAPTAFINDNVRYSRFLGSMICPNL